MVKFLLCFHYCTKNLPPPTWEEAPRNREEWDFQMSFVTTSCCIIPDHWPGSLRVTQNRAWNWSLRCVKTQKSDIVNLLILLGKRVVPLHEILSTLGSQEKGWQKHVGFLLGNSPSLIWWQHFSAVSPPPFNFQKYPKASKATVLKSRRKSFQREWRETFAFIWLPVKMLSYPPFGEMQMSLMIICFFAKQVST